MKAGSTSMEIDDNRWVARGYDLKKLLSQIYDIDERRIEIGDDGSGSARYDVTLQMPHEMDDGEMQGVLKSALEQKFRLKIAPESRTMDVYVLTAANGPGSALHPHRRHGTATLVAAEAGASSEPASQEAGQITYFGKICDGVSTSGIAASAGTIGDFLRTLEPNLDRLLVDETHLSGSYDFQIGNYSNQEQLFKLMHDQLGIAVVPAQRKVTVLTVRPAEQMQAAL